ncbi:MAG: DUF948 domain-containing protein [Ignavibacteria bacterium]
MEETIQYLEIATNIIIILLFLGLVILVFKLISILKQATSKIDEVSTQVKDIKAKIDPVIVKVQGLTDNVNNIVVKVNDNLDILSTVVVKVKNTSDDVMEKVKDASESIIEKVKDSTDGIIGKVKESTDSIIQFERKVRGKIEPPVLETANTISAVSIGVKTFFDALKNRKRKKDIMYEREIEELNDSMDEIDMELNDVNDRLSGFQK